MFVSFLADRWNMPASQVRRLPLSDLMGEARYLKYVADKNPGSGGDMTAIDKLLDNLNVRH